MITMEVGDGESNRRWKITFTPNQTRKKHVQESNKNSLFSTFLSFSSCSLLSTPRRWERLQSQKVYLSPFCSPGMCRTCLWETGFGLGVKPAKSLAPTAAFFLFLISQVPESPNYGLGHDFVKPMS